MVLVGLLTFAPIGPAGRRLSSGDDELAGWVATTLAASRIRTVALGLLFLLGIAQITAQVAPGASGASRR